MRSLIGYPSGALTKCIVLLIIMPIISCSELRIGLVYPDNEIEVSSEKLSFPMNVRMKVFSDLTFLLNLIDEIKLQIVKMETIPGVNEQATIKAETFRQIAQSNVTIDSIVAKLNTIYKYRSDTVRNPTEPCSEDIAHNLDLIIYAAAGFIKSSVTAYGTSYTADKIVPGGADYSDLVNVLQDAYLHLRTIEDEAGAYLEKLEVLTSGQVSPAISAAVQLSSCVVEGEIDNIKLKSCEKTSLGLLCSLHVEIFLASAKYTTHIPINYNGVQVQLPENKLLAKSKDNDYGLLSCSDRESFVKDCTYQNWEHAKDIFNENPMDLIEKFNFTIAEPPLPTQLKDGSVLIMDKRVKISTKADDQDEKNIPNESPMAISFPKTTTCLTILGKTKLKFKGGTLDSGLNIITSNFNASAILAMHVKALKQTGLNWSEIFKYASVVLQVVVLPVALTTCSISVYAIIKAIRRRRKKSKQARIDKKYALRRNFELNKKVARKVRRMEP